MNVKFEGCICDGTRIVFISIHGLKLVDIKPISIRSCESN